MSTYADRLRSLSVYMGILKSKNMEKENYSND